MTDFKNIWNRMADSVATINQGDSIEVPPGFATRVVAQAFSQTRENGILELLLPKILGVSCLLMILTITFHFTVFDNGYEDELLLADQLTSELFLQ